MSEIEHGVLSALGFRRQEDGWRREDVQLTLRDGWLVLEREAAGGAAGPLRDLTGRAGLWKRNDCERRTDVFEMPMEIAAAGPARLARAVRWALATAREAPFGSVAMPSRGGRPPSAEKLDRLLRSGDLTVQSGEILLQGAVCRDPSRLALIVPLCCSIPAAFPPVRRRWLRELLVDAQNRWRMVRLCWDEEEGGPSASPGTVPPPWAEIDLTGAPPSFTEALFPAALAAIRWVAAWVANPADFLARGTRGCRALEACFTRD